MDTTNTPGDEAIRSRADLLTALVLLALGLAVIYLSWTMPRLEARRINPATIPGLVPLVLGVLLTLCSALLAVRSWRIKAPGAWRGLAALLVTPEARRVLAVMALALFYTLILVGWLPFWAASMLFIFSFIVLFEVVLTDAPMPLLQSAVWALGIAVAGGTGIYLVFARVFLVRLP
jgi:putative tricarboxylic transport membrane protein